MQAVELEIDDKNVSNLIDFKFSRSQDPQLESLLVLFPGYEKLNVIRKAQKFWDLMMQKATHDKIDAKM